MSEEIYPNDTITMRAEDFAKTLDEKNRYREALEWIARVWACDYEYRKVAKAALIPNLGTDIPNLGTQGEQAPDVGAGQDVSKWK